MKCKVEWCDNVCNRSGKGYYRTHYDQMRKHGYILPNRTRCNRNDIVDCGTYYEIVLRNIRGKETARSQIDKEDLSEVCKHKWSLKDNGYVRTLVNGKTKYLHNIILERDGDRYITVDHINRDKLDNRRKNLRVVPHFINMHNRSVGNGVRRVRHNKTNPFRAATQVNGQYIWIGYFKTEQEANEAIQKVLTERIQAPRSEKSAI